MSADLVVTFGVSEKDVEPFTAVRRAGIPVLVVAEYTEDSPLGRAEWLKVFGLLVGKSDRANQKYGEVSKAYQSWQSKGRSVLDRPSVLLNSSFQGIWYMREERVTWLGSWRMRVGTTCGRRIVRRACCHSILKRC